MHSKLSFFIAFSVFILISCHSGRSFNTHNTQASNKVKYRTGVAGNTIVQYIQDKDDPEWFTDPIDDSVNYKRITDNIYRDKGGRLYLRTAFSPNAEGSKDTFLMTEYFKDITGFLDLKTYRKLKSYYFTTKGKVYLWWGNDAGEYPVEVTGADPSSFIPFDSVAGGRDKNHVFYGGPPDDLSIIQGADPQNIKVLNPKWGCWNGDKCYFVDGKSVYCGLNKIKGADPGTFELMA